MVNQVKLDPSEEFLSIELMFGFTQFAKYRIILFDQHGQNPKVIGDGTNVDDLPLSFPIGVPAKSLIGRFLTWQAMIGTPADDIGQQYSMKATFTKDGNSIQIATFTQTGPLDGGVTYAHDLAEFIQAK